MTLWSRAPSAQKAWHCPAPRLTDSRAMLLMQPGEMGRRPWRRRSTRRHSWGSSRAARAQGPHT
jgi:hypothetical protein